MLSHDEAQKRLSKFQIKNWEKHRLDEVGKLPEKLRTIGRALLDKDATGKVFKSWQKRQESQQNAVTALAGLSAKDRQRIFATLFPKLGVALDNAWDLLLSLPYETSSDRKGFRASSDPNAYRSARQQWIWQILHSLNNYDPDLEWVATWASYISNYYSGDCLGILLGAGINAGGPEGDKIFEILKESASNQHEIGSMGRHVTRALLVCSRPEAWEFVEKLLLAAQRQEGLRQVILEAVDEAHPEAFKRMLRLILDNNLVRFSATVRAIDVWFGLNWDALTPAVLKKTVEHALLMLNDDKARAEILAKDKGEPLYLALWSIAFTDAYKAIDPAVKLLKDPVVERRFIAVTFLEDLDLPEARKHLIGCMEDEDLRIAVTALNALPSDDTVPDLWDPIIKLLGRMPSKNQTMPPLVWPWREVDIDRGDVAGELVTRLGKRPATVLIPYLSELNSYQRGNVAEMLAKMKKWDAATRDTLFQLTGDRDSWVRTKALEALKKCDVTPEDAQRVEGLLVRKSSEMRQGVLRLLIKQKLPDAIASADRLLASKKAPQRQSGLELLRQLVEKKKGVAECRQRAEAYREKYQPLTEDEDLQLEVILDLQREKPSLKNALGLMDLSLRSKPVEPTVKKLLLWTPATAACLKSLDDLVHEHRQTPIRLPGYEGEEEELLGNVRWGFPTPDARAPIADELSRLPLREVWLKWYEERPKKFIDRDGMEMLRASIWWNVTAADMKTHKKRFGKAWGEWLDAATAGFTHVKLRHDTVVANLLQWFLRMHPPEGAVDWIIDTVESIFAHVPEEDRKKVVDINNWQKRNQDWRNDSPADTWINELQSYRRVVPESYKPEHQVRMWKLMHWRDEPRPGVARMRPDLELLISGTNAGLTTEADLYDHLIGPNQDHYGALRTLTRANAEELRRCPPLAPIVQNITNKVLDIELQRGELPTAASPLARAITSLTGMDTLFRVLKVMGTKSPSRGGWGESRIDILTHFLEACIPGPGDTPEAFAARVKKEGLSKDLLPQLAFLAPSWVEHIEFTLGWNGFREGVWWFLAHMPGGRNGAGIAPNDDDYDDDYIFDDDEIDQPQQQEDPWERIIRDRTPLTEEDRQRGAVDAAWFYRVYDPLGRKKWNALSEAAKYGTTGNGHKKATFLSEVLLGRAKKNVLISNIRDKKLKESVRLLGLLPLPDGERRETELLTRYKVLIEYRRYARSLGPMSREDSEHTARIGLENLARTAGYPDPIRLEWAMEGQQIADLAAGPVSVTQDGVTVTLAIDENAQPEVTIRRGDRPLKAVPPAVRKQPKVAALMERRADLKRQASRVKYSLEAMMIRGDTFTGRELRQLATHPLLRIVLERLVLIGDGLAGYPVKNGEALENHEGKRQNVKMDDVLRIAHPHDLFTAGNWDRWQADLFKRERVQPFKQVFRELYLLTAQERNEGNTSKRYSDQQVNPSQGKALFGNRGWRVQEDIEKTFYDANIVAEVTTRYSGWTPLQVEGLTIGDVRFRRRGEYEIIGLDEVPPRIFSEVMRDCDLVVSVAHVGGVDPEASASTIEMRTSLLRETCSLLGITNFTVKSRHMIIDGKLGNYSLHLGSGVVHRMPGGSVCIIPVHSQHRGRLFLPFADDDPRTAEIISKALLLTRDNEIQDPTILDQLR